MRKFRTALCCSLLGMMAAAPMAAVAADAFPTKPVRWIVPFPPGGATDIIARLVAEKLSTEWKQPVVVENRAGAAGTIGSEFVARSTPDGYTLLMATTSSHAVGPATGFIRIPYDNIKDFTTITQVATYPNVLLVHPDGPKTAQELIDKLKSAPGKYSFGSSGAGTSTHLTGELFKQQTGTDAVHIPYKGTSPMMTDLAGGNFEFGFDQLGAVLPLVRGGKLRALGVTSTTPNDALPGVPALSDVIPGFVAEAWIGTLAPANTPEPVVEAIRTATAKALQDEEVKTKLKELGAIGVGNTPAEFKAFIQQDTDKWRNLVKSANITAD